jgi:hypothetical protein
MTLSPAATIVMTRTAERPDRRLEVHRKLPTAVRHKMIDALLRDSLIVETQGDDRLGDGALRIEDGETGLMLTTLVLTEAGLRAVGAPAGVEAHTLATAPDTASHAAAKARGRGRSRRRIGCSWTSSAYARTVSQRFAAWPMRSTDEESRHRGAPASGPTSPSRAR